MPRFNPNRKQHGFTLVEMLVTVVVTLLVMLTLVTIFEWVGQTVSTGRATIEMQGNLRSASMRLLSDLEGLTVPVRPWPSDASGLGYFEYVEGVERDSTAGETWSVNGDNYSIRGDRDDVLMFTSRSNSEPFRGTVLMPNSSASPTRLDPSTRSSDVAEIVWWSHWHDRNGDGIVLPSEMVLCRRVFLVIPELNTELASGYPLTLTESSLSTLRNKILHYRNNCDLAVTYSTPTSNLGNWSVTIRAASLSDLTRRENRCSHSPLLSDNPAVAGSAATVSAGNYPFPLARVQTLVGNEVVTTRTPSGVTSMSVMALNRLAKTDLRVGYPATAAPWSISSDDHTGEDVMLSGILGFDVKAFDPAAPIISAGGQAMLPGDTSSPSGGGYDTTGTVIGRGAFADLFFAHDAVPGFYGASSTPSYGGAAPVPAFYGFGNASLPAVYDTWSTHYESDGIDQDGDGLVDEGMNGLDDDGVNGTDDPGERETSPPYPVPLRGLQIRIRIYDPDSRQVRQQTVTADFTPE